MPTSVSTPVFAGGRHAKTHSVPHPHKSVVHIHLQGKALQADLKVRLGLRYGGKAQLRKASVLALSPHGFSGISRCQMVSSLARPGTAIQEYTTTDLPGLYDKCVPSPVVECQRQVVLPAAPCVCSSPLCRRGAAYCRLARPPSQPLVSHATHALAMVARHNRANQARLSGGSGGLAPASKRGGKEKEVAPSLLLDWLSLLGRIRVSGSKVGWSETGVCSLGSNWAPPW